MPVVTAARERGNVVAHSVRTPVAARVSFLVAMWFRIPEAYWAPITTIVIMQSSLGAAFAISWQRFAGIDPGDLLGGIVADQVGHRAMNHAIAYSSSGGP
jgi:uncharacterized membrane protein YgaE (UPF0421/DUF939 family)